MDIVALIAASIVLLALVMITSVILIAWQTTQPILNETMTQFGVSNSLQQLPNNIGNNLYSFDLYIPIIFYFVEFAVIFSTLFIDADPLSWIVSILLLPIIYWVSAYISNSARAILTQPILSNGVQHLPQSIQILANLQTITFIFGILYIIVLCLRLFWWQPGNAGRPTQQRNIQ